MPEPSYHAEKIHPGATVLQGTNIFNVTIQPQTADDAKEIFRYLDEKRGKLEGPGLPRQLKPEVLYNRYEKLQEIQNFFEDKQATTLYVWGISGIGKSTLVRGALETRNKGIPVVWIHCKGLDIDTMLLQINSGFKLEIQDLLRSNASRNVKIQNVLRAAKATCVLVLNEFEAFLDEKEGYLSEDIESLINCLSELDHKIKVLAITNRLPRGLNQANPSNRIIQLKGLKKKYAEEHFRNSASQVSVDEQTINSAIKTDAFKKIEGHPYFLEQFAGALKLFPLEEVENELLEATELGDYILKKVLDGLDDKELEVLRTATIFNREFKFDVLKTVYKKIDNGVNLSKSSMRALVRESLIELIQEVAMYYVHPLLRDAVSFESEKKAAAHGEAASWFLSKTLDPANLKTWDEGLYHLRRAAEIGTDRTNYENYKKFVRKNSSSLSWAGWGRRVIEELKILMELSARAKDPHLIEFLFVLVKDLRNMGEEKEAYEIGIALHDPINKVLAKIPKPWSPESGTYIEQALEVKLVLGSVSAGMKKIADAEILAEEAQPMIDFLDTLNNIELLLKLQRRFRYLRLRFDIAHNDNRSPKEILHNANEMYSLSRRICKISSTPISKDYMAEAHFAMATASLRNEDLFNACKHYILQLITKVEIGKITGIAASLSSVGSIYGLIDPIVGGACLLAYEQITMDIGMIVPNHVLQVMEDSIKNFLQDSKNIENGRKFFTKYSLEAIIPYYERALARRLKSNHT